MATIGITPLCRGSFWLRSRSSNAQQCLPQVHLSNAASFRQGSFHDSSVRPKQHKNGSGQKCKPFYKPKPAKERWEERFNKRAEVIEDRALGHRYSQLQQLSQRPLPESARERAAAYLQAELEGLAGLKRFREAFAEWRKIISN